MKKFKKHLIKKKEKGNRMNPEEKDIETTQPEAEAAEEAVKPEAEAAQAEPETEQPTAEQWAEALKKTVAERDTYKDNWMRAQADFQNFKRRNATSRADGYEDGVRETLFAALPVMDSLEMAIKHAEAAGETGAILEGVKLTLKTMTEAFKKLGLEEVPALGESFDPELHNAVMREPGGEENIITEVFQKGYRVKEKMIRYAMVKVSSGE